MKQYTCLGCRHAFQSLAVHYFDNIFAQTFILTVGMTSIVVYIADTYEHFDEVESECFEIIFFLVFGIDYIFSVVAAPKKMEYIFSFIGLADLMSILPVIDLFLPNRNNVSNTTKYFVGMLRMFRLVNIYQIFRLTKSVGECNQPSDLAAAFQLSELSVQVVFLVTSILAFLFFGTGIVYAIANTETNSFDTLNTKEMDWFTCLYFVICSGLSFNCTNFSLLTPNCKLAVTTVGYGDIVAVSVYARIATVVIIICGFAIIPLQAASLLRVIFLRPQFLGSLSKPSSHAHVCLCGVGIPLYIFYCRSMSIIQYFSGL